MAITFVYHLLHLRPDVSMEMAHGILDKVDCLIIGVKTKRESRGILRVRSRFAGQSCLPHAQKISETNLSGCAIHWLRRTVSNLVNDRAIFDIVTDRRNCPFREMIISLEVIGFIYF